MVLSFDPVNGKMIEIVSENGVSSYLVEHGLMTNISATISAMSNVGPGFEAIGPYSSFAYYSYFSKIVLSIVMLVGRLEIIPVLILFSPRTWKK
jgi:trk system potassium uptake protein TrkH